MGKVNTIIVRILPSLYDEAEAEKINGNAE
jgi:hypothetical protein